MTDGVERCVRKGKGEEVTSACVCLNLLLLQLGPGDESTEIYQQLRPTLTSLLADKSVSARARSAVSTCMDPSLFLTYFVHLYIYE